MSHAGQGMLASFDYLDSAVDAIKGLRKAGFKNLTAFAPYPDHHIEDALGYGQSPVRVFTFVGGLTGAATGFAFTTWTAMDWPLVVGGKPIVTIPAFIIISFEMMVLFGALSTIIGLFILAKIPWVKPSVLYDPEFSAGRYGVYVEVPSDRIVEARSILAAQEPAVIQEGAKAPS